MTIWDEVKQNISFVSMQGELLRIVESQEQVATNNLVDSLDEQALLEQMLDESKPNYSAHNSELHYLLYSPFRYPPLAYGSRFGSRHEAGLFYGSKSKQTTFSELAYYRFVFWHDMAVAPGSGELKTQHTLFGANYNTAKGLQLHKKPFLAYQTHLTNKENYSLTQELGTQMRNNGVEIFEYSSARDIKRGINIALFSSVAFADNKPSFQQSWMCHLKKDQVTVYSSEEKVVYHFKLADFLFINKLPQPA